MDLQSYIFISLSLQTSRSLLFVTSIFILLSEDRSVLWLLRTKIREPFGLSQIFCLLVKRTGLAYQRIILHIGNWWTIGKKLPQDAINPAHGSLLRVNSPSHFIFSIIRVKNRRKSNRFYLQMSLQPQRFEPNVFFLSLSPFTIKN